MERLLHISKFSSVVSSKPFIGAYKCNFIRTVSTISHHNSYKCLQSPIGVIRQRNLLSYNDSIVSSPLRVMCNQKQPEDEKRPQKTESDQTNKTVSQKLKQAVAEYGSTVIVFHITISLVSLGFFYMLVSSGLDVTKILLPLGISNETTAKIAGNAGTFAIAYGVHKVFAPVRIGITLTATPFIVRYLRKIGLIKHKK